MEEIVEYFGTLASFIGSLTVVGSALIWIYNKFIGAPRERKREQEEEKRHKRMIRVVTKENEPLVKSIDNLTSWIEESRHDRENLNKIADKNTLLLGDHGEQLDEHNGRLIALETKNGITTVKYREKHGEDK